MKNSITNFFARVRAGGLFHALKAARQYVHTKARDARHRRSLKAGLNIERQFTRIFNHNYWGSNESVSGPGSTMASTETLRGNLPALFQKYAIQTVFDAPCGDFNWMRHVVEETDISYIGADIVKPLVQQNRAQHSNPRIQFQHLDITQNTFPEADLWICRDCLFHFSYRDTALALRQFIASGIPYILTTTHLKPEGIQNHDIQTGAFRSIDLFESPYNFPRDVLHRITDYIPPNAPREMCLWTRDQIRDVVSEMEAELGYAVPVDPN